MFWPQPTTRWFDTGGNNAALIHTFEGWRGPVCGATLELRLRAQSSALSTNDSIRLELRGGSDHQRAFRYWTTIRNVVGAWGPGAEAVVELNLGDLPPYVDFPTSVLRALHDGRLDLLVEDDTAIDYALLTICRCASIALIESPVSVETASWGRVKSRYR
jgi:hypothetical protein